MGNSAANPSGNEELITSMRRHYITLKENQLPIVYSEKYNIEFFSLENCHPFDAQKWGRIYRTLVEQKVIHDDSVVEPNEISEEELGFVHSKCYLCKLKWSWKVAAVLELPVLLCCCHFLLDRKILKPMRYQTAGTITAARLALQRQWSINIGGGFHHSHARNGMGFCPYADITLAIQVLQRDGLIKKAMIVDLDAHQGNGHERDFKNDQSVYILDAYNKHIFPLDGEAKKTIRCKIELKSHVQDDEYLALIAKKIEDALAEFEPDLVVYNAGTDVLDGDALGGLSISEQGIIKRDEFVFATARRKNCPIVMVTSGGYHRRSAGIVARSIMNLAQKQLITLL